jgi:hypothetical protein
VVEAFGAGRARAVLWDVLNDVGLECHCEIGHSFLGLICEIGNYLSGPVAFDKNYRSGIL